MNDLRKPWKPADTSVIRLLASLCLCAAVAVPAAGDEQLFTLMPTVGEASMSPPREGTSRPQYASGVQAGTAPIQPVPMPLTPIPYSGSLPGSLPSSPYSARQPGSMPSSDSRFMPPTGKLVPGQVYYFDSAGRPMKSPYDRGGFTPPAAARPKFDYSLAPIQPAARPRSTYISRTAVAAESSTKAGKTPANPLVRQERIVSAEDAAAQRMRARNAKNNQPAQGSVLSSIRRVVSIENGRPRSMAQAKSPPPAPKCPNCGKRKPLPAIAASGATVRR